MNKIGMRNFKTMMAILICIQTHVILTIINPQFANDWFSPFFAGIAAAYSLQSNQQNSARQARIRSVGSIVGGVLGMLVLSLYDYALEPWISSHLGIAANMIIYGMLVALIIIPLIHYLVRVQQSQLVFVAILTYLSVTVGTRNNLPVHVFGINRISSTIFGVMIALALNQITWHFHKNKDILFVSGLDGALLNDHRQLSNYSRYKLGQMLSDGMQLTISTTRTPASLVPLLDGLDFPDALMIMNGAAVFNMKTHHYSHIKCFDEYAQKGIQSFLKRHHRNAFVYTIIDDVLTIHHSTFSNEAEKLFYEQRRNDSFRSHVKGDVYEGNSTVFYILIDLEAVVRAYETEIKEADFAKDVLTNMYPFEDMPGFYYLKINSATTSKLLALDTFVASKNPELVVTIGSMPFDLPVMNASDFSLATHRADEAVRHQADYVLESRAHDAVVRELARIFYHSNPKRYLRDHSTKRQ